MECLALTLMGVCMGSFANVCIHRLPKDESLWRPRSHCPLCQTPIHWLDNIPLVSYLLLKGRCRNCRGKISLRYPTVELACAALWLAVGIRSRSEPWALIPGLILVTGLLVSSFTDLDCRLIPNEVTFSLIVAGLALSFWNPTLGEERFWRVINSAAGLAWGGGLLWLAGEAGQRVWKKDAMGGGDIKLAAGIGSFLGWRGAAITIVAASLFGALWGMTLILAGRIKKRDYIPFGPFLSLGGAITWFFPYLK
jgi:leader peptidase (prepilin peptidase)/N-methyltransferase